jgi:hypothetical protein
MLVGRWAEQHPNKYGGTTNEVATLYSDGTYIMDINRTTGAGLVERFSAFGEWGLAGDIHFTKDKGQIIDGEVIRAPPGYPDTEVAYKVISLTPDQFVYCDIEEDVTYHAKKAGRDE